MKQAEDFKRAMGPVDERFDAAVRQTLASLQTKEEPIMKRKVSAGLVLALVIVLALSATAMAGAWPKLLDMLMGEQNAPGAEQLVLESEGEVFQTRHATFTVREKLYDGYGAYLVLDVTPNSEQYMLLPSDMETIEDWRNNVKPSTDIADVPGLEGPEGMTVGEYCIAHGLTPVRVLVMTNPPEADIMQGNAGTNTVRNPDGSMTILTRASYAGYDRLGMWCYTETYEYRGNDDPDPHQSDYAKAGWFPTDHQWMEYNVDLSECRQAVIVSKTSTEPIVVERIPELCIESVTVFRTPITTYIDVMYSLPEGTPLYPFDYSNRTAFSFMPLTLPEVPYASKRIPRGKTGYDEYHYIERTEDGRSYFHQLQSIDLEELPDGIILRLTRNGSEYGNAWINNYKIELK